MTLAYNYVGKIRGDIQTISDYIVATSNDTTATVTGPWIDNRDGKVRRVNFGVVGKNKTGTSPTLTVLLQGADDPDATTPAGVYSVLDSGGNAITTSALSISSTDGTAANYATEFEDTNQEGINCLPPIFRLKVSVGGSNTPGGTYDVMMTIDRSPLPAA